MSRLHEPPAIDERAIEDFCTCAFGYLDGHVPIRLIAEKGTPPKKPESHFADVAGLPALLRRLAPNATRRSQGVFVVPCTFAAPGLARAADVAETAVIVVDLDAGDVDAARDHLIRHIGPASLEVASGGRTGDGKNKLHLYWRLTEPARGTDLGDVARLRSDLARKVGGDSSLGSLHQPIRVPGSTHGKHGVRTQVRILRQTHREYELEDLIKRASAMPVLPGLPTPRPASTQGVTARELQTMTVREGGVDGITRFDAISKTCGHWLRNARLGRCSLDEAWTALCDYNAATIAPPWDELRLRQEFERLHRLDLVNHASPEELQEPEAGSTSETNTAMSEDALATEFARVHGGNWRYVGAWGAWLAWSETHWSRDETAAVRETVRQVCRRAAAGLDSATQARRLASEKTIGAVTRIASSDPLLATRTDDWDALPWILNTPEGVVDLETGEIARHDRRRLVTQITEASPGSGCPGWQTFVEEITDGDRDLANYLRRFCGYCLTGSTREQVFVFLHGQGANGKSVFLQTLSTVLGSYAATATLETFMASKGDRHLTELAGLRGSRLVIVPETEPGRAWAEGRINTVTGGERIRANFMRQNHFEFTPQFRPMIAGIHRPELSRTGEAMRRRLHLVPFTVTIPPERRDRELAEKLRAERDGILGWMIEGCLEWQREGLMPPARVTDAVDEYFTSEDVIGQWIAEQCSTGSTRHAIAADLYRNWSVWAEAAGQAAGSQKSLGEQLRERGFRAGKVGGARGWHGIALRRAAPEGEA